MEAAAQVEGGVPGMGILIDKRPRRARALGRAQHASMLRLRPVVECGGKAPPVENFAWLPVGVNSNKTGRGSVSLI